MKTQTMPTVMRKTPQPKPAELVVFPFSRNRNFIATRIDWLSSLVRLPARERVIREAREVRANVLRRLGVSEERIQREQDEVEEAIRAAWDEYVQEQESDEAVSSK